MFPEGVEGEVNGFYNQKISEEASGVGNRAHLLPPLGCARFDSIPSTFAFVAEEFDGVSTSL